MKRNNIKYLLISAVSAAALLSLSGCGGSSCDGSSDNLIGEGNYTPPPSNEGRSFHTSFLQNYSGSANLAFYIASAEDTDVTIKFNDDNTTVTESLDANVSKEIIVPTDKMLSGTGISNKTIEITSDANIIVVALNQISATTDASLILPDQILSQEYYTAGYQNISSDEFSVVAIENSTTVNITLPDGTELTPITLNKGEVYQYQASTELTGTHITSNQNIAVQSGNQCTDVPDGYSACDHIGEQMLPVNTWEKTFITVPLATRMNGDTFRFVASVDGTQISKDGTVVATIDAGKYYETVIDGSSFIEANNPIMALQYSNSSSWDSVTSDPFMALVPAIEQYDTKHIINTPNGFTNYINIVVPSANVADITMDGTLIDSSEFTAVSGNTAYSTAQIQITEGSHVLTSTVAFGLVGYGFASYDSYGYPSSLRVNTN